MEDINRIKTLMERVETKNFLITEQDSGLLGGAWDLATGAVSGLYDGAKDLVNKGIPYLVDKTKGVKLLQQRPFSGKIATVINSASKLFVNQLKSRVDSDTELYNTLVILQNLVTGAQSRNIKDNDNLDFKVWEVLEAFTVGVYLASRGKEFTYSEHMKLLKSDTIDDISNGVVDYVEGAVTDLSISGPAKEIKEWYPNFFKSGQENHFWDNSTLDSDKFDRLDGEWDISKIPLLINSIDLSKYEGKMQSEFETRLSQELPCYTTGSLEFVKLESGVDVAIRREKGWFTIFYYNKANKLTANIYYKTLNSEPIATSTDIDCSGGGGTLKNVKGINESLLVEQSDSEDIMYGKIRVGVDRASYSEMKRLYSGGNQQSSADDDQESSTTTDTTTIKSDIDTSGSNSDSGEDTTVIDTDITNTQKLIDLLVSKGVDERLVKIQSRRAEMGSIAVGKLEGRTVTNDEYIKDEEEIYSLKFIESIEKGITTINGSNETNHEKEAKEEDRVIDTTSRISNPTPLEVKKIEEIGDDAVSKTNNELKFDKNRIKTVRVTSNDTKVVYVATEDITDIISKIEGELEQVFGGDWFLDKARNKFMSSNKLFIFKKKE